jgi:hypothetical protein
MAIALYSKNAKKERQNRETAKDSHLYSGAYTMYKVIPRL